VELLCSVTRLTFPVCLLIVRSCRIRIFRTVCDDHTPRSGAEAPPRKQRAPATEDVGLTIRLPPGIDIAFAASGVMQCNCRRTFRRQKSRETEKGQPWSGWPAFCFQHPSTITQPPWDRTTHLAACLPAATLRRICSWTIRSAWQSGSGSTTCEPERRYGPTWS
jgi:hypothetical protein